ncbi:MAG: hypothetical protein A3F18_05520 [Legionellales bacterium RIFCSPHIGHO2_12_FULL_37_14]|nr:MAG: hypothetical protein A3F18_05520 [Legionellales bacterium RIFCSPHIGHO2_12_FULL_37_14]
MHKVLINKYCSMLFIVFLMSNGFAMDKATLQRGARFYMNYCFGCHSLKYMRNQTMMEALGFTNKAYSLEEKKQLAADMLLDGPKEASLLTSLPLKQAVAWFGVAPPDLSLVARSRGRVWLNNFLHGYYKDSKKPFGANNLIFPDVAMPDVLFPLRGEFVLDNAHKLRLVKKGAMEESEFNQYVNDLVEFLVYVAEPTRSLRYKVGFFVIILVLVLLILVRKLQNIVNKKYK